MQRAKLFVKLKYSHANTNIKEKVRSIKFKKLSNVMINDQTLPTKGQLIKILKEQLFVDYRSFKMNNLKNIKERIILLIFIYHKVLHVN